MKSLCTVLRIASADHEAILDAIDRNEFEDFEDCLQECCAANVKGDYIITRNISDYKYSNIPAILPEDFLSMLQDKTAMA